MRVIRTEAAPAPVAGAPYSQATLVGGLLFVSGQIPIDPATVELVPGDIAAQTHRAMANLLAVVEAAGGRRENIARCTIYVTDLGDFGVVNAAYAEALGDHRPARATVEVSGLPLGAGVEIDAIAHLG